MVFKIVGASILTSMSSQRDRWRELLKNMFVYV